MTLPARTSIASITYAVPSGSAASGDTYNITYNFLNNDEFVNVWYRNANSEKVELTLDSDFRIDISSGTNNVYGVCVLLKDIPDITSITLERSITISQDIDFNNSTLYPSITEYAFDKLTAISQDQNFKDYTIHAPADEVVTDPRKFELPPEEERLGKIVGFDGQGKVAMYDPPEGSAGYTPATRSELGAVIIGDNLTVENSGLIDVPVATTSDLGVVKVGTGIAVNNGTISVDLTDIRNNAATAKTNSVIALSSATSAKAAADEAKDTADRIADLFDWYIDGAWTETTTPLANPIGGDYRGGKFILAHGSTNKYSYSTAISPSSITWQEGTLPSTKNWMDVSSVGATVGQVWNNSTAYPSGKVFYSVTTIGDRLVAVGYQAHSAYSDDEGKTWTLGVDLPTGETYRAVISIGTRLVAVGSYHAAAYSDDKGETWTVSTTQPIGHFNALTVIGNRIIAVGDYSISYSDDNGVTWTYPGSVPNEVFKSVTTIGTRVIALGLTDSYYSDDSGATWTQATAVPSDLNVITAVNNRLIAVGYNTACFSDDLGATWSYSGTSPSGTFYALTVIGNRIITVGVSAIAYSDNMGQDWVSAIKSSSFTMKGVTTIGGKLAAVGEYGMSYSEDNYPVFAIVAQEGDILYSADGTTWNSATLDYPGTWDFVTSKENTLVAVGDGKFGYSTDYARNWTVDTAPWSGVPSCLAASDQSFFVTFIGGAYKSSDGTTFSAITMPNGADKMCFGNGRLVALVGNNAYYSDDDGSTWTTVTLPDSISPSDTWAGVAYGGNRFVGITDNSNKVIYSSDGATWHMSPVLPHILGWNGLLYGKDRYLALHTTTSSAFKVSLDIVQVLEGFLI